MAGIPDPSDKLYSRGTGHDSRLLPHILQGKLPVFTTRESMCIL